MDTSVLFNLAKQRLDYYTRPIGIIIARGDGIRQIQLNSCYDDKV